MNLQSAPRCTYIRVTGHACKSPALKGKNFCYFHERVMRGVAMPIDPRIAPMFVLEDRQSIQYAIMEIMNSIANGTIEHKTASLLLRALNIAERNSRRSQFHQRPRQIVQEVPNYGRQYLNEHPEYDSTRSAGTRSRSSRSHKPSYCAATTTETREPRPTQPESQRSPSHPLCRMGKRTPQSPSLDQSRPGRKPPRPDQLLRSRRPHPTEE